MSKKPEKYLVNREYESAGEFLAELESRPIAWSEPASERPPSSWSGNVTTKQAIELARYGWQKGRDKMAKVSAEMASPIGVETFRDTILEVAGAYPIVPIALSGDPCAMVETHSIERPSPILRIGYSACYPQAIGGNEIMNFGAAILSYVDALEANGWRCELWADSHSSAVRGSKKLRVGCAARVCLKRSDEPLDIDTMAFFMAHPAFPRRLEFRWEESFAELERWFSPGYGVPVFTPSGPGFDIFFSGHNADKCVTPEKASTLIGATLSKALEGLTKT